VHVTPLGYKVLELLMREPGNVYSRRDILAAFGAHDSLDERSVDVHLNRLRRALNAGRRRDAIKTVRGRGYMIA
jgi:two-component system phosphate regulon response regulator PhoB